VTAAVLDRPAAPGGTGGGDLVHVVCCDPGTALCGAGVAGDPWVRDDVRAAGDEDCRACLAAEAAGGACRPGCPGGGPR
jgi:hypothetical protein